jgi:hypothetical protein
VRGAGLSLSPDRFARTIRLLVPFIAFALPSLLPCECLLQLRHALLLALGSLAVLLFPWFEANASLAYMVPMFFYEVPLGLWFLIKGVRTPTVAGAHAAG